MAEFDFSTLSSDLQVKTDAELAAILPTLTNGPIPVGDIITWLRDNNLAILGPGNQFEGTMMTAVEAMGNATVTAGINKFLGFLITPGAEQMHTNTETTAVETAQVLGILQQAGVVTTEQIDAFYSLDGGLAYPAVTEAEITTSRAAFATQVGFEAAFAHIQNTFFSQATTTDELITACDDAKAYLESL